MKFELEVPDQLTDALGRTWEPTGEIEPPQGRTCAVRAFGQQGWHWEVDHGSQNPLPNPILRRKRWRAPNGERYYLVKDYDAVDWSIDTRYGVDDRRYRAGNYYRTREEAETAAGRVKAAYCTN